MIPRLFNGGYEWSTVSESDFLRIGSAGGGSGVAGAFGLRASEDVEELERDTDKKENGGRLGRTDVREVCSSDEKER